MVQAIPQNELVTVIKTAEQLGVTEEERGIQLQYLLEYLSQFEGKEKKVSLIRELVKPGDTKV